MRTLDRAEREAGVDRNREAHRVDLAHVRVQDRRLLKVERFPGRQYLAPAALAGLEVDKLWRRALRHIARRDHHRETQGEGVAVLAHRLLVFDLDDDRFPRTDIGDRIGEDIGALLFDQAGAAAIGARLLVDLPGFLLFLDLAFDDAGADHHFQRVDGRVLGQGKDVFPFHPAVARIDEVLRHSGARQRAGHIDLDVGGKQWRRHIFAGFGRIQQQGAAFDIRQTNKARAVGASLMLGETDDDKQRNANNEKNPGKNFGPALPKCGIRGVARCVWHDCVPATC